MLNLDSNKNAPKVSFQTSKLAQGVSINLSKANPHLKRVGVKINWKGDDLDISAVGKCTNGKALMNFVEVKYGTRTETVPRDLIFYMNLEQKGIKHGGDLVSTGNEESEAINIATQDLNDDVKGIDFIVTSHVESGQPLLFKDVTDMRAEMIDLDTNQIIYQTELDSSSIMHHTGAVFAKIYKEGGEWNYKVETQGLGMEPHGVQNILNHYYA